MPPARAAPSTEQPPPAKLLDALSDALGAGGTSHAQTVAMVHLQQKCAEMRNALGAVALTAPPELATALAAVRAAI